MSLPPFPASRDAALARLEAFVPLAGRAYAARRNHDAGPEADATTSRLSPAIRRKLVSEAEVAARVVAAHGFGAAEKFVQEVCWRSYWVGWLRRRPQIWTRWRAEVETLSDRMGHDAGLRARYAEAVQGRTGIDCFDAWVVQLRETGWLHNHVRMSFASIWIFTLNLPWQLGAELFWRQLLDACPAANTLSWRWVAGLHTQGKTYLARADLIRDLSGGRFAVAAPLARNAPPLPPDAIPPLRELPAPERPDAQARTGLFVTTEDLSLETLDLSGIAAVAATTSIGGDPDPPKKAYAEASLADGLARAATHFGCAPDRIDEADPITAMRDWAARHRLTQIVTGDAPVGPVADRLAALAPVLAGDGVRLVRLRRAWDDVAARHATRGYFAFRGEIPKLLTISPQALC